MKGKGKNVMISLIVPCYNEEDILGLFLKKTIPILQNLNLSYEIVFVNDGSTDNTLNVLLKMKETYKQIRILNFSRNFGKEAALTAGIEYAKGEAVIPIDADLQHPPELINIFVEKWKEGNHVVLGKRITRTGERPLKKFATHWFYLFQNKMSEIAIPEDIGDYRLMSRKVVDALLQLPENQRFMKGIFAWVGFKTVTVEYSQQKRVTGQSSFNGWKLWNFALEGITSFSTVPLRIWLYMGMIIAFLSFFLALFILIDTLVYGVVLPGYVSTILMILFLGGIQLIGIGILGEYIGRIYKEAKRRPIYIIENEY